MSASISVRLCPQLVRGPDGAFHHQGSLFRSGRPSTEQTGDVSRNGRTRQRKRSGISGAYPNDQSKDRKKELEAEGIHRKPLEPCGMPQMRLLKSKKAVTGEPRLFHRREMRSAGIGRNILCSSHKSSRKPRLPLCQRSISTRYFPRRQPVRTRYPAPRAARQKSHP